MEFYNTGYGRTFFSSQLPKLIKALENIADALEKRNEQEKTVDKTPENKTTQEYVTELCPHCEREVDMSWSIEEDGYQTYCPYCGKRLMLCSECMDWEQNNCDFNSETGKCKHCLDTGKKTETQTNLEMVKSTISLLNEYCEYVSDFGNECAYTDSVLKKAYDNLNNIIKSDTEE